MSIDESCPTTKDRFDIWNSNEVRFSGTERCIVSWDETPLSLYTAGGIANHFLRSVLHTTRGRARINGVASPTTCGGGSIAAPLPGVAVRMLHFGPGGIDLAGPTLVGQGTERGSIQYEPQAQRALSPALRGAERATGASPSG